MATFSVRFLGCKVSHVDAQEIRERLLADGHSERRHGAEVAIVNTCCVTHEAVRKSRHAAARAARTHARVYVTGCGASLDADGFAGLPENVVVVGRRSEETPEAVARDVGAIGCVRADARLDRIRAFVKVQDGCSFSCNFCVIPQVRGASRSRRAEAVLREIERRVEQGHREVVLTGINLGCYRDRDAGYGLPRLVREAGSMPGLARLRLSSIEINHVGGELTAALRETPTVARHLHVPLQSGDDGVLRAMGRRYDAATYLRRLEPLGDFNLTTDVIVGFPAEDERAFRRTLEVVEAAGVSSVHVFPYSPRPGTATAAADTVPREVKRDRSARLREASRAASLARWREKLGHEDVVLVDRPGRGYGDDYSPWLVDAPVGELVRVRGEAVTEEGFALPEDCVFCTLVREGDHVRAADGFVAIRDVAPKADTHLLVLPERHVSSFREISEFPADEAKRMLDFIAETAKEAGLEDYRVVVNVGEGAGQTVFHLHWHVLGGRVEELPA